MENGMLEGNQLCASLHTVPTKSYARQNLVLPVTWTSYIRNALDSYNYALYRLAGCHQRPHCCRSSHDVAKTIGGRLEGLVRIFLAESRQAAAPSLGRAACAAIRVWEREELSAP
eukprot:5671281-Amphidinium_carterae.1